MTHVGLEFYNDTLYPGEWFELIKDPIDNVYMGHAVRRPLNKIIGVSKDFLQNLLANPEDYFGWKIGKGPKDQAINIF